MKNETKDITLSFTCTHDVNHGCISILSDSGNIFIQSEKWKLTAPGGYPFYRI